MPGAATAAALGVSGVGVLVVNLQHGAGAEADLPGLMRALVAGGAAPLVRTRSSSFADIGRPLDLGAHGVLVTNVRAAEHAHEGVAFCRYGPDGVRSYGRLVEAAEDPVCLLLETAGALADLDRILTIRASTACTWADRPRVLARPRPPARRARPR